MRQPASSNVDGVEKLQSRKANNISFGPQGMGLFMFQHGVPEKILDLIKSEFGSLKDWLGVLPFEDLQRCRIDCRLRRRRDGMVLLLVRTFNVWKIVLK